MKQVMRVRFSAGTGENSCGDNIFECETLNIKNIYT